MSSGQQLCCAGQARRALVQTSGYNGIDYIEIERKADRHQLKVYFFHPSPAALTKANFVISGGRRVRDLCVHLIEGCSTSGDEASNCVTLILNRLGDASTYRLSVVETVNDIPTGKPFPNFDARYYSLNFSFGVDGPSELDCKQPVDCPPSSRSEPAINYLAKDYASFRQLLLDRLALIMPDWRERHVPDLGITLIELLAYVGDYLSYYQDAVATEAYLDTARRRISVRRHARLVDYFLHEGCNARAWVHVDVEGNPAPFDPTTIYFITGGDNGRDADLNTRHQPATVAAQAVYFEPVRTDNIVLYEAHNVLHFYTWGDTECTLPKGATRATLHYVWQSAQPAVADPQSCPPTADKAGSKPTKPVGDLTKMCLAAGDVLIFEEIRGPQSVDPADADPRHRHAVRLTRVDYICDTLYTPPVQLVEIAWGQEDALPFSFRIAARHPSTCQVEAITVARGNLILVDHGRSVEDQLPAIPSMTQVESRCEIGCPPADELSTPVRFTAQLPCLPITHRMPLVAEHKSPAPMPLSKPATGKQAKGIPANTPQCPVPTLQMQSARAMLVQDPHQALPIIRLRQPRQTPSAQNGSTGPRISDQRADDTGAALVWEPRADLLSSGPDEHHFVAEIDNGGYATLRFGDGQLGAAPLPGSQLTVDYRIGNGSAGNVGADVITQLVYRTDTTPMAIRAVRNPLPAQGGIDAEPIAQAKLLAPQMFRQQLQRAVRAADYAHLAERNRNVQRATGSLRWTGSWYAVQVSLDPYTQAADSATLLKDIAGDLHLYRRIGHDLKVMVASYVPLDLALQVCLKPHVLRGNVRTALLDRFSNRTLRDGQRGFFHPDNLTFGQAIYVSELMALAQGVSGVESVEVKTLRRRFAMSDAEAGQVLAAGVLQVGPLEIPQLDNDPGQPENGRLQLSLIGGR